MIHYIYNTFMNKYFNNLPDDLINKIYYKIYYSQDKNLLNEIKIVYYIKNNLVKDFGLNNICCCALIHYKNNYNINDISINDIDTIYNVVNILPENVVRSVLNNIIGKMPLNYKYSLIFHLLDKTITPYTYNDEYIKIVIDNIIGI